MGKRAASASAGSSAAAEGHRAERAFRWRRRVNALLVVASATLAAIGLLLGRPWLSVAACAAIATCWSLRPAPDPQRWLRGAVGERSTAHILQRLPRRWVVLHDRRLPGGNGNIDHLVIGPYAVWVIDSKARRARLQIRVGQVWAGEHIIDSGPVSRQAASLSRVLGVPVRAVISVHGHGLRRRGKKVGGVRIIPARSVARTLKREKRRGRRLPQPNRIALAVQAERLLPPY